MKLYNLFHILYAECISCIIIQGKSAHCIIEQYTMSHTKQNQIWRWWLDGWLDPLGVYPYRYLAAGKCFALRGHTS